MRPFILGALLVLFWIDSVVSATQTNIFEIEAEGSYRMNDVASIDLAKKMALFSAKRQAVDLAGRYLSRQSLIKAYELNRDEIYSLAAREIETEILAAKRQTVGKNSIYRVRIRARVQPSDFVKAEMADTRRAKQEAQASFSEEMEQPVPTEIDPGQDISKVYRLLREKKWRIVLIYMNHLEKKYPNWAYKVKNNYLAPLTASTDADWLEDAVWIDLVNPTAEEVKLLKYFLSWQSFLCPRRLLRVSTA